MQNNSSLPAYAPFSNQNSEKLPAQFVLKLSQPFPIMVTSIDQITNEITEPATIREYYHSLAANSKESIVTLIARQELDLNKGPFCRTVDTSKVAHIESCDLENHVYSVKLPDEAHTYHVFDNYLEKAGGVYISKMPFTHPTSIPSILKILRQQAMFNFVIGSCMRRSKHSSGTPTTIFDTNHPPKSNNVTNLFDVVPVSLNTICISFEHPSKESLASLELDLKELSCHLYALDKDSVCSDEFATEILKKCWSMPITLRSVLRKCNEKRLALLEDTNKRRERELQELLNNSATTQQGPQLKINSRLQDTLQNKFNNINEKPNSRDLNSIAEFLSSKLNDASTSGSDDIQSKNQSESSNSRTNLLKKFSCKPKIKQSVTTKSQTGNKILSLMLKRTPEDQNLKGPVAKKVKTKHSSNDSSNSDHTTTGLTTTKLITPEMASAARLASKQAKQQPAGISSNVSISLIRSPTKSQLSPMISSTNNQPSTTSIGMANTNSTAQSSNIISAIQKQSDSSSSPRINDIINSIKIKAQANGGNSANSSCGKPRKSSIGALLDRLVGNVTPEQQQQIQQQQQQQQQSLAAGSQSSSSDHESAKLSILNGAKSKASRQPGGDQFAIKQGSSGSGLKLTVTKTKPTNPQGMSLAPSSQASATLTPSTTVAASSNQTTTPNPTNAVSKSEASKLIDIGSSTPSIRYTIPKISKSQQASQSSNNTNENSNDSQNDDSNPSSSANSLSTASSSTTTAKPRTTSNPFRQTGSVNRNSVSSSTHPPNRTTSNPLANPNRPTSTSNSVNDTNLSSRISSSNNAPATSHLNQQLGNINSRQQPTLINRSISLMPNNQASQIAQIPLAPALQQLPNIQHMMNPSILSQPQQVQQLIRQPVPSVFPLQMPNQQNAFSNPNDLNLIVASQAALLNQQKQLQIQQQQHQLLQQAQQQRQVLSQPNQPQQSSEQQLQQQRVSSSTEPGSNFDQGTAQSSTLTSSTPSSPTECNQVDTVAPPPLIPIDSLDETNTAASPDEDDSHDDESDRLSIVDINEAAPDCNSTVGTPKTSQASSPTDNRESSATNTSSAPLETATTATGTATISSAPSAATTL